MYTETKWRFFLWRLQSYDQLIKFFSAEHFGTYLWKLELWKTSNKWSLSISERIFLKFNLTLMKPYQSLWKLILSNYKLLSHQHLFVKSRTVPVTISLLVQRQPRLGFSVGQSESFIRIPALPQSCVVYFYKVTMVSWLLPSQLALSYHFWTLDPL